MSSGRFATGLLVGLALLFPVGALLQPWLAPSRSALPIVPPRLVSPTILVTVGGLSAERVHHLGYGRETTPNLDRVAEQGITFTRAYANANEEVAATASVMTAACPGLSGVHGPQDVLAPELRTLAERFAASDYATYAVVANPALVSKGFEQGFDVFDARPGATAEAVFDRALELVRASANESWLLWIDLGDLLAPYGGTGTDVQRFAADAPAGFGASPQDYALTPDEFAARGWGSRHVGWLSARYDAALFELDAALGGFLLALEQDNRLETLSFCLAGTSGTLLDQRKDLYFAHGVDLYEHSLQVPLVFRLPSQYIRGLRLDGPAQSVEVGPALTQLALQRGWKGALEPGLARLIEYQAFFDRRVWAEGLVRTASGDRWRGFALRTADWKVILDERGQRAARFQLDSDPDEQAPQPIPEGQLPFVLADLFAWRERCEW